MKAKEQGIVWSINRPIKLYLDDLTRLYEVLTNAGYRVDIELADYEGVGHPSELAEVGESKITELSMIAYPQPVEGVNLLAGPMPGAVMSVELHSELVLIWTVRDEPVLRGIADEIREILVGCKRHLFTGHTLAILIAVAMIVSMFVAIVSLNLGLPIALDVGMFIVALGGAWLVQSLGYLWDQEKLTTILPKYREDSSDFWTRNRDNLAVGVLTALAGGLFGFILGQVFG